MMVSTHVWSSAMLWVPQHATSVLRLAQQACRDNAPQNMQVRDSAYHRTHATSVPVSGNAIAWRVSSMPDSA
eukprot:556179-Rhodomonas_salina.1